MEPTEINLPPSSGESKEIILKEEAQYFLHQAGKWARFLGIMGFIGSGFLALFGVFFGTIMSAISQFQPSAFPAALGGAMGLFYVLFAAVYFYISLKLYQFGSGAKDGIEYQNSEMVSNSLGKLKSFFKIKGIILICILSLYALIIIVTVIAGIVGASLMHR